VAVGYLLDGGGDGGSPAGGDGADELASFLGQAQGEVAPVGGGVGALQQAGGDEPVAGAGGVGGVDAQRPGCR
jgi:hypothetical protein